MCKHIDNIDSADLGEIQKPSFFLSRLIIQNLVNKATELKTSTMKTREMFNIFTSLCQ